MSRRDPGAERRDAELRVDALEAAMGEALDLCYGDGQWASVPDTVRFASRVAAILEPVYRGAEE